MPCGAGALLPPPLGLSPGTRPPQVNGVAALEGGRVVSASDDTTLKVWDAATGEVVQTLQGGRGAGAAGQLAELQAHCILYALCLSALLRASSPSCRQPWQQWW